MSKTTGQTSDMNTGEEDNNPVISATFQGKPVKERILKLDAERYKRGDIPLDHLLVKYLSYLIKQD